MRTGRPGNILSRCRASSYVRAGDRVRTGDPQLGKLMLYQLSYSRLERPGITGPPTPRLSASCVLAVDQPTDSVYP